jgi:uncharacterized membrane protein (Fun14 family)
MEILAKLVGISIVVLFGICIYGIIDIIKQINNEK